MQTDFGLPATVGDFVGSLCKNRYRSVAIAFPAEGAKALVSVDIGAYRALPSDTAEKRLATLGVRVVAGSNPAAPTKENPP
jgi:hypothetical protein